MTMGDGLLQRFSTIAATSSSSTSVPPFDGSGITQRIHHEPLPPALINARYPVYGPGTGPDLYDDVDPPGEFWPGSTDSSGQGGFFPSFLPWGQPHGASVPPVPPAAPPLPPPAPPYPLYRGPYGGKLSKGALRFRGASVTVLTLLAFLFFLSILQNYIRDYSATSQPTVILLSAGATKENLPPPYPPFRVRPPKIGQRLGEAGQPVRFETDTEETIEDETTEQGSYRARVKTGPGKHRQLPTPPPPPPKVRVPLERERGGAQTGQAPPKTPPLFSGDIFQMNGL